MEIPIVAVLIILLIAIIVNVIFGLITQTINEEKGYSGGFWLGFFKGFTGIAIVKNKPDQVIKKYADEELEKRLVAEGGWKCANCGNVSASYVTSCTCGLAKADNDKFLAKKQAAEKASAAKASPADEIAKYKKLLDDGAITKDEFAAKKKQLLGL